MYDKIHYKLKRRKKKETKSPTRLSQMKQLKEETLELDSSRLFLPQLCVLPGQDFNPKFNFLVLKMTILIFT